MAASNLTNKLKVFAENTVNKQTDTEFTNEDQRDLGYSPNTVISSKVMNTALRQATLINVALIEALKQLSVDDLVNPITFGSNTSVSDAKDAIVDAINKIKIPEATLADNVQPGTIVSDSMTSRKYKHGWQISQDLKKKLTFKSNWVGQHMNNDVLYFGTTGILKGYYLVHGLTNESVNEGNGAVTEAGKLTITAGQTPATGAISGNLKRLTFETELGSDTALSKVTSISGSSTDNQIPSAKAVWNALEDVEGGMDAHSGRTDNPHSVTKAQVGLSNVTNDKQLKDSDKVTVISSSSTDTGIPSAKAAYTAINTVATNLSTHVDKTDNPHAVTKAQVGLTNVTNDKQLRDSDKVTTIASGSTDNNIPSAKAVYSYIENGIKNTLDNHINDTSNPHNVTKVQVGLSNVENKSSATIRSEIVETDIPDNMDATKISRLMSISSSSIPNNHNDILSALATWNMFARPIVITMASYTVTQGIMNRFNYNSTPIDRNVSLNSASNNIPVGSWTIFFKTGSGNITFSASSSNILNGSASSSYTLSKPYSPVILLKMSSTNDWVLLGDVDVT